MKVSDTKFLVIEKYSSYVILENNDKKFIFYNKDLEKGNTISLNYTITILEENNSFNEYLKSKQIFYLIEGDIISNNYNLTTNEKIINSLLKNKDEENRKILKLILFNKKDESNSEFYKFFEEFSITFLLVISGFHINLLFKCLNKTKFIKYIFPLFYLYLLDFSVSSFRAFLYFILKKIVKKMDLLLNNCDILSLILISFLFINPGYCFDKGFIYSFSFSFIMDILNNSIGKNTIKVKIIKKILIYCLSIPITLRNNYQINTNSLLINVIFTYPISFLFVFSLVYLFLDKFYMIYKIYIYLLKLLLGFFSNYSINLILGKPGIVIIILMYFSLFLVNYYYQNKLYKRSFLSWCSFIFICILQYNIPILDSREMVYFLNVGQGDCSVLKIKNSKKVVLIDTGGSKYRNIANDTIIPFLKSKGINEIEKLIISHDDFDHNGASNELILNFKVDELIDSSKIENINIGDKLFVNLNVNENRDNDGSIVLYGEYGELKYLFTGDISSKVENEIVKNKLDVDVLKVSHHGSKESTSETFLSHINARVALIGVGKNNRYNHPSKEVIERLKKFNVFTYRTDMNGTIGIYKSLILKEIVIEND